MVPKVSQIREEMADREAIRDCLFRYCRGIDRMDPELLATAYWPGAMDYHTGFTGTVEQFIEWALPRLAAMEQAMHMIGNIFIRIEGDKAKVTLRFRGREMAHQDLGVKLLERVRADVEDLAVVESMPRLEGRQMIMMLGAKKKK